MRGRAVFEAGFSNPPVNLVGADTVTQLLEVTDERQASEAREFTFAATLTREQQGRRGQSARP
ncbi:MAG: hypothetical protein ACRDRP_03035 [Pseudonocardiaceae bacterium]